MNGGRSWTARSIVAWLCAYVVLVGGIVWGFQIAYGVGTERYSTTKERDNWRDWRAAVVQQNQQDGPVERRVPKSEEPPFLVLMRDYYTTCLVGSLIFATAIFVSLMFFIRGVAGGTPVIIDTEES